MAIIAMINNLLFDYFINAFFGTLIMKFETYRACFFLVLTATSNPKKRFLERSIIEKNCFN